MNNFIKNIITNHNKKVINIFLVIIVLLVIYQWFKTKTIIAAGETGLPFYNVSRTYELSKFPYLEVQFGVPNPFFLQFRPIWGLLRIFEAVGITSWVLQALFFFLLINIGLLTFPHLVSKLFGNEYYFWGVVGGLFYTFNLYVLSQVWARFLYSLIFLWSLLPLMLLLWIDWINKGSKKRLLVLMLILILFAGVFALPSNIIVVWAIFGIYVLRNYFNTKRKIPLVRGILGLFIWVIVNIWWLVPTYKIGSVTYASMLKAERNMNSLRAVTNYYSNSDIITLKQKYYFGGDGVFKDIGDSSFKSVISWSIFVLVLIGTFQIRKNKNLGFIFILFWVAWFLSKGSNAPGGDLFYSCLYKLSKYFEVLRNPYEKVGILYIFAYSIFFSFGLKSFCEKLGKIKYYILVLILFLAVIYLPSPMYSARVFSKNERLKVPRDYLEIDKALTKDGRVLHLPFQTTANITYTWGYRGEEPSMYLLNSPSISAPSSISELDNFYFDLGKNLQNKNFRNILEITNTRYLLLHEDKNIENCFSCDMGPVKELFSNNKDIVLTKKYGELSLYEYSKGISGWIYGVRKYSDTKDHTGEKNIILSDDFSALSEVVISENVVSKFKLASKMTTKKIQKVDYIRVNPVNYRVDIKNCDDNFILVLVNNYNEMWQATIEGIPVTKHFMVNGFSNAWLIEKRGDFNININFNMLLGN